MAVKIGILSDTHNLLRREVLSALEGYQAGYTHEVTDARSRWAAELDRLRNISFGDGYVPEVNDANAASAFRFAKDLDCALTQTQVLGAFNLAIDPEDNVIGASGSLPGDMQRMWCARAPEIS